MFKLIVLVALVAAAVAFPQRQSEAEEKPIKLSELEKHQNEAAQYAFSSSVEDHINGLSNAREETRDGLKVKGHYSYSDGYYKRTITYEADENGYRVVKEEVEPLEGPIVDPNGTATIMNQAFGQQLTYRIQSVADQSTKKV